jgi:hypothetical protein
MTVLELITDSLAEIGVIASGEPVSADDAALALRHLNAILDDAAIDRSKIHQINVDSYTLTPSLNPHTIGVDPAGVLTATLAYVRPSKILRAFIGTGASRREIDVLTEQEYANIMDQTGSGEPSGVYPDYAAPLCGLYFYPVPSAAYVYEQHSYKQFTEFSSLTSILTFPPGYRSYFLYELTFRLAGPFKANISATTADQRQRAQMQLQTINAPNTTMELGVYVGGGSDYSVFTDQ